MKLHYAAFFFVVLALAAGLAATAFLGLSSEALAEEEGRNDCSRKKRLNRRFMSWVRRGVDKHPALVLPAEGTKKLIYCKNKDSCAVYAQNTLTSCAKEIIIKKSFKL